MEENTQDVPKVDDNAPEPKPDFINPIDVTKVAENPGFLPYAHTAGGAVIRPEDKGRIKGNAMMAMYEQTDRQIGQLREQMETLVAQAKSLQRRKEISEVIYEATLGFRPVVGHIYHLYRKKDASHTISLIAPDEWEPCPYTYLATVQLLYDHTWEVLAQAEEENFMD
jgi:Protein of unknown function (DUF2452)